jgi:hypothetical protein
MNTMLEARTVEDKIHRYACDEQARAGTRLVMIPTSQGLRAPMAMEAKA